MAARSEVIGLQTKLAASELARREVQEVADALSRAHRLVTDEEDARARVLWPGDKIERLTIGIRPARAAGAAKALDAIPEYEKEIGELAQRLKEKQRKLEQARAKKRTWIKVAGGTLLTGLAVGYLAAK